MDKPVQWQKDVEYLAKLADFAAGQGICQIEGLEDPDEWCALKWDALVPDSNGTGYGYSAQALADGLIATIQRAFEERQGQLILVDDAAVERVARAIQDVVEPDFGISDRARKQATAAIAAMGGK